MRIINLKLFLVILISLNSCNNKENLVLESPLKYGDSVKKEWISSVLNLDKTVFDQYSSICYLNLNNCQSLSVLVSSNLDVNTLYILGGDFCKIYDCDKFDAKVKVIYDDDNKLTRCGLRSSGSLLLMDDGNYELHELEALSYLKRLKND